MAAADGLGRAMKGLSEAEFRERFGTEEACREALFRMRWRGGLTCPACGHRGFCQLKTRRLFQCNRCKRQVRLTAGTVFQDTKLPLTTWFAAIYHLTQSKNGISSIELGRRLGVKQGTAWLMKHKLMRAMATREAAKPKLSGRVEVDDAYLGGERSGGKRGRGAAGKQRGQRRPVLLAGGREGRLPTLPDGDRRRQAGGGLDAVPVGQHHARQHQDGDRRHLPPRQPEARTVVPRQLRLPVQPPPPARQHRRAARLGRRPYRATALPGRYRGCVSRLIRFPNGP